MKRESPSSIGGSSSIGLSKQSRAIFQLGYALTFKHKFSPDLYAFSASIKDLMIKEHRMYSMTVDEAMEKFGDGKYTKFYDWKRRVLDPAIKEINTNTDLDLCVEFLQKDSKYRTKITHILFGVTRKVGADLSKVRMNALGINKTKTVREEAKNLSEGYVEEYAVYKLGFSPEEYDEDDVLNAIEKYENDAKIKRKQRTIR